MLHIIKLQACSSEVNMFKGIYETASTKFYMNIILFLSLGIISLETIDYVLHICINQL